MDKVVTWSDLDLLPHHVTVLTDRGITPEVAHAHGYRSSTGEGDLRSLGYRGAVAEVSGALVIPLHDADGEVCGYQIRPDDELPGDKPGSVLKYLTPPRQSNVIDIPVRLGAAGDNLVSDPNTPIIVTEGPLKAAAASSRGIPCVSIQGVSCYVGTTSQGGKGAYLPDWRSFASNRHWIVGYDSDAMTKPEVLREAQRLGAWLGRKKGAKVSYLLLPGDETRKVGIDDYLVDYPSATLRHLLAMSVDELPDPNDIDQSDPDAVRATDLELSDAYVNRYGSEVRYVTNVGNWIAYQDGFWDFAGGESIARANAQDLVRSVTAYHEKPDGLGGVKRTDASQWLYTADRITSCLAQVRSNRATHTTTDDFNRNTTLLNVANGTVDLTSGMLHDHDPRDLITQRADVLYDPDAECPEFERFIREVLPDKEVRGFVQRLFGMSLLGEVRDHVFTVFTGTGRNGKGVLTKIAQAVFGDYATGINKELLVQTRNEGHLTMVATLYGRRLAIAQELDRGARWDVTRVKELTGGDRLTARRLYENEWTFTPSHTIIMTSNHRPSVGEGEGAFWARYREVPFTESFEGREDTTLADRIIDNELPGVLQWMLRGLKEYLDHGLGSPDAVTAATREAREESDPLLRFIHERMRVTGETSDVLGTREIFDAFSRWAATEGDHIKVGSYLRFGRELGRVTVTPEGPTVTPTVTLTPKKGTADPYKNISCVSGVTFRGSDDSTVTVEPPKVSAELRLPVTVETPLDQGKQSKVTVVTVDLESSVGDENENLEDSVGTRERVLSDSTVTTVTTVTEDHSHPVEGVTESDSDRQGGDSAERMTTDTVATGLLSDGSVSPDYRIVQGQELGQEVVSYEEWVRRMKLAGKWVEPEPGFTWSPVDDFAEDGDSEAA